MANHGAGSLAEKIRKSGSTTRQASSYQQRDLGIVSGILDSKDKISEFLGNASDYMLKKYVSAGMPVRIEDGRWLAHIDNIEEFFRAYTRVDSRTKSL